MKYSVSLVRLWNLSLMHSKKEGGRKGTGFVVVVVVQKAVALQTH